MAAGWNSGSDREAMLRRVAIVLSSLPAPMASKLLGSIGPDSKQAVRRTMSTLTDVDPLERQRAIQAFKVMLERNPNGTLAASEESDSLQIPTSPPSSDTPASSRIVASATTAAADARQAEPSPLSFLSDVEDLALARLLTAEHPQTIAFVLVSISPEQAARVLPRLGAKLQQETMSRIGRLGEIPETAVAEVAEHFRSRLQEHTSSDRHCLGRQALDAILAAMPKETNEEADWKSQSTHAPQTDHVGQSRATTNADVRSISFPATEVPALDLTHRLKVAEETWPDQFDETQRGPTSAKHTAEVKVTPSRPTESRQNSASGHRMSDQGRVATAGPSDSPSAFASTDSIHQHLIRLSPVELCRALGEVDTRNAMLALCGLPVQVADAALAKLPRAQAKMVRKKMNALGSLHLREIDRAKEKVAEASLGTLPSPSLQTPIAA